VNVVIDEIGLIQIPIQLITGTSFRFTRRFPQLENTLGKSYSLADVDHIGIKRPNNKLTMVDMEFYFKLFITN
jgi:hypothetical protein